MNNTLTSPDYISNLHFDFIETYSFCRGTAFKTSQTHPVTNRYLWTPSGTPDISAQKTNSFSHSHPRSQQLISILQTPAINIPHWMCAPFFRDAVVFYNHQGKIISTLNICFSCSDMQLNPTTVIEADEQTYKLLKNYFIEIGHEIEEERVIKPFSKKE